MTVNFTNSTISKLLEAGIDIVLTRDGFYVPGFYGLNEGGKYEGYALLQFDEQQRLYATDLRGSKVYIEQVKDIVFFNNQIWASFYRTRKEDFSKPSDIWLPLMIEYGAINITPGR